MTRFIALPLLSLLGALPGPGQNVQAEPPEDEVLKAIHEFNQRDGSKPNEVTVVLDPPAQNPPTEAQSTPPSNPAPASTEPVLVTGTPPQDSAEPASHAEPAPDASSPQTPEAPPNPEPKEEPPPPPKPRKGLAVRVEKLQSGSGDIDPDQVKLLAPFPAKPISNPPAGWQLEASDSAPPFTREVELAPGRKITLKVRPHVLVPQADGSSVFNISEPGFDPALGYRQNATVGAVLSNSIRQMDEDAKQIGQTIDNLQQLLVSLPKPEPAPQPVAPPATLETKPARKR